MGQVLEHTNILSLSEKYAADVVELAKVLDLPQVPERIEGYDISNIFGKEAVGSMVVFADGEPDKSQYRKFKIKIGQGQASDTRMLREVLERRLKHTPASPNLTPSPSPSQERRAKEWPLPDLIIIDGGKGPASASSYANLPAQAGATADKKASAGKQLSNNKWPLPDLIIIDGGKGQLNVALRVIEKAKLEIPVIAISKGKGLRSAQAPDKIFFPGEKQPLELSLASPALHIIKRVRDEAHRFAISYHRLLRKKKVLK
jgi:excinuclease ABC subunit C